MAKKSPRGRKPGASTGRAAREKVRDIFVPRPFAGLTDEREWVALRELVPAATAAVRLAPAVEAEFGARDVVVATVLPMAWPAMHRADGTVFIGLQRHIQSGDVSRDLAAALLSALQTPAGRPVAVPSLPGPGPRLQDVLVNAALPVTLHEGFEFWLAADAGDDPNVKASLERANESIYPTVRMAAAPAAYWCQVPDKAHVRWVLPDDEDPALDALARLAAADAIRLGDGTKFAGMFRAHGLLVPVWDLPMATPAVDWEAPLAEFAKRYTEALASAGPLTSAERRSRQGLLGRQLTLR